MDTAMIIIKRYPLTATSVLLFGAYTIASFVTKRIKQFYYSRRGRIEAPHILPDIQHEILNIFMRESAESDILSMTLVCKHWSKYIEHHPMWLTERIYKFLGRAYNTVEKAIGDVKILNPFGSHQIFSPKITYFLLLQRIKTINPNLTVPFAIFATVDNIICYSSGLVKAIWRAPNTPAVINELWQDQHSWPIKAQVHSVLMLASYQFFENSLGFPMLLIPKLGFIGVIFVLSRGLKLLPAGIVCLLLRGLLEILRRVRILSIDIPSANIIGAIPLIYFYPVLLPLIVLVVMGVELDVNDRQHDRVPRAKIFTYLRPEILYLLCLVAPFFNKSLSY
jgi:hypothetical protein